MKYLEDDLIHAVSLIKDYLSKHCPGGSIRLTGGKGTLVLVSQDPTISEALNATFDANTTEGYEELTTVTVKDGGEC